MAQDQSFMAWISARPTGACNEICMWESRICECMHVCGSRAALYSSFTISEVLYEMTASINGVRLDEKEVRLTLMPYRMSTHR